MVVLLVVLWASPVVLAQTVELAFTGPPVLESGTNLREGAVYRYSNVLLNPPAGAQRDVLVEIRELRGAFVTEIDDETTSTPREFFAPKVARSSSRSPSDNLRYARFRFTFVDPGTTTENPIPGVNYVATSLDTDGDEFVEYLPGFTFATAANPTFLTPLTPLPVTGGAGFQGPRSSCVPSGGGVCLDARYASTAGYSGSVSQFEYIAGVLGRRVRGCDSPQDRDCTSSRNARQTALSFQVEFAIVSVFDFGDAPSSYGDAFHRIGVTGSPRLGADNVDDEPLTQNGAPNQTNALGDDLDGNDDEDGVAVPNGLVAGDPYLIPVDVQGASGHLSAWVDWNGNGAFDSGEEVATDQAVAPGIITLTGTVPANAQPGTSYARFRICSTSGGCDTPTGEAGDGEVEDYSLIINLQPTLATISALRAFTDDSGQVQVEWTTEREVGTLSFELERWDETHQDYLPVTDEEVPALGGIGAPQGGVYTQVDDLAYSGERYRYRLIEREVWGGTRIHGPFEATVDAAPLAQEQAAAQGSRNARAVSSRERRAMLRARVRNRAMVLAQRAVTEDTALVAMVDMGRFRAKARKLAQRKGPAATPGPEPALTSPALTSKGTARATRMSAAQFQDPADSGAMSVTLALSKAETEGSRARLAADVDGLYSVSAEAVASALGETTEQIRQRILNGTLALSTQGRAIAWEAADALGSALRFVGAAPPENTYTAETVYWIEPGPGTPMDSTAATVAQPVTGQTYLASERFETDSFALSDGNTDPESDYWRWAVMNGNASWNDFETQVALDDPVPGEAASLRIDLQSIRDVGNAVIVTLNGTQLPDAVTWQGARAHTATLTVPADLLQDGDNTLRLEARPGDGGTSYVYLDGFTIGFERFAVARGGALDLTAAADAPLGIDGFPTPDIAVYRLGDRPERLTGVLVDQGAAGTRVSFAATAGERYLAVGAGAEIAPSLATRPVVQFSPDEQVDYVVIADRTLAAGAEALAAHRASSGLSTRVVFDDDLADAFNHGMASPHNLRAFLDWANTHWGVRYAVLAGNACSDYKGVTGLCEDLVSTLQAPTPFGLFACDGCLGDADGDGFQDVQVSRIPAASNSALAAYVSKLQTYEATLAAEHRVLLVADHADPDAGDFAADSDLLREQLALLAPDVTATELYLDDTELASARSTLKKRLGEPGLWTNFLGHSGGSNLSKSRLLVTGDEADISGGSGVLNAMTCVVSLHDSPYFQSLSEALVLDADGGPVASIGPSGQSLNSLAVQLNAALLEDVFANGQTVLGDAVGYALHSHEEVPVWMRRIYNLLGDVYLQLP